MICQTCIIKLLIRIVKTYINLVIKNKLLLFRLLNKTLNRKYWRNFVLWMLVVIILVNHKMEVNLMISTLKMVYYFIQTNKLKIRLIKDMKKTLIILIILLIILIILIQISITNTLMKYMFMIMNVNYYLKLLKF